MIGVVGSDKRVARSISVVVALTFALVFTASAPAAREPTFKEREALTAALPPWLQREPVGCVWLDIRVSNNGRYATAGPVYLNALHLPCLRYAANGFWILKKTTRWKIIYNGSGPSSCSLHVPKDLITGCTHP